MNAKNQDLQAWGRALDAGQRDDPLLNLAAQLQEERPLDPAAPPAFKSDLRRRLTEQHAKPQRFHWFTLRRAAGSLAAVSVLALAVLLVWFAMRSQQPQPTPGEGISTTRLAATLTATPPAPPAGEIITLYRATVANPDGVPLFIAPGGDLLRELPQGTGVIYTEEVVAEYNGRSWREVRVPDATGMSMTIGWVPADGLSAPETSTVPGPPADAAQAAPAPQLGDRFELIGSALTYPGLPPERPYPAAGDPIELTLNWRTLAPVDAAYIAYVYVLDFRQQIVAQRDQPLPNGLTQDALLVETYTLTLPADLPNSIYSIRVGIYDAASGERLTATVDGQPLAPLLVEFFTVISPAETTDAETADRVWLESVYQAPRTTANAPIRYEAVVGYELVSADTAALKLHLAHPEWASVETGRVPIDGVTDAVPVTADRQQITLSFTVDPAEKTAVLGTAQPVLVATLSADSGAQRDTYAMRTFSDLPAALFALDAPQPAQPDTGAPPTEITIGASVAVANTEGAGVTVRADPAADGRPVAVAGENSGVFVIAGPRAADAATWWQVRLNDGTEGWVNAAFLETAVPPAGEVVLAGTVQVLPDVSPPAGAALSGAEPLSFEARLFYTLRNVPEAVLAVNLVDVDGGRALRSETVTLPAGSGLLTVRFTLDPTADLPDPTTLQIAAGWYGAGLAEEPGALTSSYYLPGNAGPTWRYAP